MDFFWKNSDNCKVLTELQQAIDLIEQQWQLEKQSIFCLRLVVEELVSNLLNHNDKELEISLHIERQQNFLQITIQDNGEEFDPLAVKEPDTTASLTDRQAGGLGIYLVKKKCKCFHYKRREPYNISTITIALNSDKEQQCK